MQTHRYMDFSFFITDNKSGYKTQEKWFLKNHPTEYAQIINYSKNLNIDLSFKEKIWFYFNNLKERPRCLTCNKEIKFRNRFDKPYGEFCSLSCLNCNRSCASHQAPSNRFISIDAIKDFLHQVKIFKWDLENIHIVGGEPTLHPQFPNGN